MGRIRIVIAPDGLTAEVQVAAGTALAATELQRELAAAGVKHGVDTAKVEELGIRLLDPTFADKAVVARGAAAQAGRDGTFQLTYLQGVLAGAETHDGHIDYHERSLLHPTAIGETIARQLPPVPGVPGRDVRGRELNLPAPKPDPTRPGEGVTVTAEGNVVSKRDGVVFLVPGKSVDVVALWQHKGDVDLHSGHLRTRGSLLVTGDVHEQFIAEASGDVLVKGAVLSGTVRAGGAAVVDQAVQGKGSEVHAGTNLTCRHANGALLVASGTVRMQEAVHCRVRAQEVELLRGRGKVVGGEVRARHKIAVLVAGTEVGAETLLATADLTDQLAELVRLELAESRVQRQGQKHAHGGGSSGKFTRAAVGASDKAQAERLRLAERQRALLQDARIEVQGAVHAGVSVQFGEHTQRIKEPRLGVTFRWDATSNTIVEEKPCP